MENVVCRTQFTYFFSKTTWFAGRKVRTPVGSFLSYLELGQKFKILKILLLM